MASSALGSQSIALLQLPSGTLIDFAGTVEPSGWLLCDGRELLKTSPTYASLFAAVGIAFGETNGSGGAGTTHFRLPDFRGRFARYNDNMGTAQGAASRDTGRAHGSTQADAMQNATGEVRIGEQSGVSYQLNNTYVSGVFGRSSLSNYTNFTVSGAVNAGSGGGTTFDLSRVARTAAETRPINLACNKLIKI